jgi:outer membrane protein assembly factor BamB
MQHPPRLVALALAGLSLLGELYAGEPTATYFRADGGIANSAEMPLPEQIDSQDCVVWRQPLDAGHSTPCIAGGRIFLTTYDGKQLATVGLDAASGKQLWKKIAPATRLEQFHRTGSPACATPASDGKRVFVFFGSYGLLCYDLDGNELWSRPFEPFQDEFGSGSSPILAGGKLILNEDHDINSFLLAVDPASGKTVWKTERDGFTRSYATPVLWNSGGKPQLVVAGALQLVGYDLDTGKQLWSVDGLARIVNTTPVIQGDRLFVATWSPGGDTDARIAMEPWEMAIKQWDKNHDEKLTREEVNNPDVLDRFYRIDVNQDLGLDETEWRKYSRVFELAQNSLLVLDSTGSPAAAPKLAWEYSKGLPYVPSPLVYRDLIFLVKDGGIVTSLDARDGKLLKQARARGTGAYYSSPVAGDGKVYLVSERGVMSVLTAEGKWSVVSSHDFQERTVATPVLHEGKIYVRTEKALYCLRRT